jgi:uncharacterized membrane protein YgaE (UPF0421/DUF939 family)
VGIRVIKTAIATSLAIYLASLLGLSSPLSAGLLAILGVDVTKKRGLKSVSIRILASILGLFMACFIFYLFGFHVWSISIFILCSFPLLTKAKLHNGIFTCIVVVLHLYTAQSLEWGIIQNEMILLIVGLGTATIINMVYMPRADRDLEQTRLTLEQLFSQIFMEFAYHLKDHENHLWDGKELLQAESAIQKGVALARDADENKLFYGEEGWKQYFEMRNQQFDFIQRMLDSIALVYQNLEHGQAIAQIFEALSEDVKLEYYTGNVEAQLHELEYQFKQMALPVTRAEFEVRSTLLQLVLELKSYLSVAKKKKKMKPSTL